MDRQFLRNLELDNEVIDKIMDEHGSSINSIKEQLSDKKDEVKSLKNERDEYKSKAEENQDAQDKINSLQSKYDEMKDEVDKYKNQIENNKLDQQIIKNVSDAYDVDDVLNYLDRDKFERDDDGNITNFEDVLNEVREKKPHYFNQTTDPSNEGGEGEGGNPQDPDPNHQPQDPKPSGVNYATGKGQGAGSTGSNDYVAKGKAWIEKLNGGAK